MNDKEIKEKILLLSDQLILLRDNKYQRDKVKAIRDEMRSLINLLTYNV